MDTYLEIVILEFLQEMGLLMIFLIFPALYFISYNSIKKDLPPSVPKETTETVILTGDKSKKEAS